MGPALGGALSAPHTRFRPLLLAPLSPQFIGQPVLIGGTMGTCSYVLTGTQLGMDECFGSTCHGAGRAQSRSKSRRALSYQDVLGRLAEQVAAPAPKPVPVPRLLSPAPRHACAPIPVPYPVPPPPAPAPLHQVLASPTDMSFSIYIYISVCVSLSYMRLCVSLSSASRQGIAIRVASPKLVMEEAPESYKDVSAVVDTCHAAGISKKVIKLRPIAVVKG